MFDQAGDELFAIPTCHRQGISEQLRGNLLAARIATQRFAREPLGGLLRAEQLPYQPFDRWHEIAQAL